jgi:hypothetical protein
VLWDPGKPASEQTAWNGKLQYGFGVASGSPRRQFQPNTTWYTGLATNELALGLGFMTAASSLTDHQLNSNLAVAAETVMMIKERIIEQHRPIRYTIGIGCSGGSIEQNAIASQYPGLLEACRFPAPIRIRSRRRSSGRLQPARQFLQLARLRRAQRRGSPPRRSTPSGRPSPGIWSQTGCLSWVAAFGNTNRRVRCQPSVGAAIFATTPRGVPNNCLLAQPGVQPVIRRACAVARSTTAFPSGAMPAIIIPDPRQYDGRQHRRAVRIEGAARWRNNRRGLRGAERRIGSVGFDGAFQAPRAAADGFALRTAYRSGIVGDGRSWAKVPIIDLRGNGNNGIHHNWRLRCCARSTGRTGITTTT